MELQQKTLDLIQSLPIQQTEKRELSEYLAAEGANLTLIERISRAIDVVEAEYLAEEEKSVEEFKKAFTQIKEEINGAKRQDIEAQKANDTKSLEEIRKQIQSGE